MSQEYVDNQTVKQEMIEGDQISAGGGGAANMGSGYDYSQNNRGGLKKAKNEERKIFVGGITWDTEDQDLQQHFGQFGTVSSVQIKYDHFTRRSRGFAFVEFEEADSCQKALAKKDVEIKGKRVEVKPAKSRENKKVFVGGLPSDYSEEQLRAHFEQFGKVDEIEWPFDKFQNRRKNFAFIVFEDDEAASNAASSPKQKFGERMCDVKIAVPQFMRPQKQASNYQTGWAPSQYDQYNYGHNVAYNYYDDYWQSNYDYAASGQPASYADYSAYSGMDGWNYGTPGGPAGQSVAAATASPAQQAHSIPGTTGARGGRGGYYGTGGYGYGAQ